MKVFIILIKIHKLKAVLINHLILFQKMIYFCELKINLIIYFKINMGFGVWGLGFGV